MGPTGTPSSGRRFFSVTGIDWDDDASITAWAYRVWQQLTDDERNHMTREPRIHLTGRYTEAVAYVTAIHATQTRKGTDIPYVCHLLGVSSLVIEAGGDEDQAIAGLLHDAAEDCGGEARLADIEARFGARVAGIVRGCSDSITENPERKQPWRPRKEAHLTHLKEADADVVMVTAADKLHNARAIWTDIQRDGVLTLKRFNADADDVAWYYGQIFKVLQDRAAPVDLTIPLEEAVTGIRSAVTAVAS